MCDPSRRHGRYIPPSSSLKATHLPTKLTSEPNLPDTCGTLAKAADTLREHGASQIVALVTHGIFSGNALKTLNDCDALSKVVATNTVPFSEKRKQCPKLEEIDVSPT